VPFVDPRSLPSHEPRPGWSARFFHSDHMTFAYYDIAADAGGHVHEHPHEEVWQVVAGVRAIQPTHAIVVDYPVSESLAGIRLRWTSSRVPPPKRGPCGARLVVRERSFVMEGPAPGSAESSWVPN
jgi:hypothetical protein